MTEIFLTESQESNLSTIIDWASDLSSGNYMVLSGSAGTGKSTLISHLCSRFKGSIEITAPTHKAVKVIKKMLQKSSGSVGTSTIYKYLGLHLSKDGDIKELVSNEDPIENIVDLLIIDECSMLKDDLLEWIRVLLPDTVKVLFVGDHIQLPPIGEELSKSFQKGERLHLTEIRRQSADNPIIKLATAFREVIESNRRYKRCPKISTDILEGKGILVTNSSAKFKRLMKKYYSEPEYSGNPDLVRTVAWTNKTVNSYNSLVRQQIYGENPSKFEVGETVIACQPVASKVRVRPETLMNTDDEGVVTKVEDNVEHPLCPEYLCYRVTVDMGIGRLVQGYSLMEEYDDDFQEEQQILLEEALNNNRLWGKYWRFVEAFDDLRPGHAITSHRSQGSSFNTVFVDAKNILKNPNKLEALKCLYVAITRASEKVIIKV